MRAPASDSDPTSIQSLHSIYRRILAREGSRKFPRPLAGLEHAGRAAKRTIRTFLKHSHQRRDALDHRNSTVRQIVQMFKFAREFAVDPSAYYKHELYRPQNWQRRDRYLFEDEIGVLLHYLNARVSGEECAVLGDKIRFADRIRKAALPGVDTLVQMEQGRPLEPYGECPPNVDLFSKPVRSWGGDGGYRWRRLKDGLFAAPDGRAVDYQGVIDHLREPSKDGGRVLQACLENHHALKPVSGKGLSTLRIVTIRPPDEDPVIAAAAYRMPQGDSVADNFAVGGLAAPVELDTGRLGASRRKAGGEFDRHPSTGTRIEGLILPYWEEACRLALAAHREFARQVSVGWDIVITPDGVVLLEGNAVWGVDIIQVSHRRPLADTCAPRYIHAHFQASCPDLV